MEVWILKYSYFPPQPNAGPEAEIEGPMTFDDDCAVFLSLDNAKSRAQDSNTNLREMDHQLPPIDLEWEEYEENKGYEAKDFAIGMVCEITYHQTED